MQAVNLEQKLELIDTHWDPKIVAELNENYIKLARIKGEFVWHKHDNEDELFYVVRGQLTIRFRDRDVHLAPGELCVIPKGVEHMPVAPEEVCIMLVEPKSTLNTGDAEGDARTKTEEEWI